MLDLSNLIIPFRESEVKDHGLQNLDTETLMLHHVECTKILNTIDIYRQRKQRAIESINGFSDTFQKLRDECVAEINMCNRCIKRLEQKYNLILEILKNKK